MELLNENDLDLLRKAAAVAKAGETKTRNGRGCLVETKKGEIGRTYNSEQPVNNKIPVFFADGQQRLISPINLKKIGFVD